METKPIKAPNSRRNLDMAIQRAYGVGNALTEARKLMANQRLKKP